LETHEKKGGETLTNGVPSEIGGGVEAGLSPSASTTRKVTRKNKFLKRETQERESLVGERNQNTGRQNLKGVLRAVTTG